MTPLKPEVEAALALLELGRGHSYPGYESDAVSLLQTHSNIPRRSTCTVGGAASTSSPVILAVLNSTDDSSLLFRYDPSGLATKDDNEARHRPKAGRIGVLSHRAALDVTLDSEQEASLTLMCMRTQLPSLAEAQRLLAAHQRSTFARPATVQANKSLPEPFTTTSEPYLPDEEQQPQQRVPDEGFHREYHHSPSTTTLPLPLASSQAHAPILISADPSASITLRRSLVSSPWTPSLSPIPESTCTSPLQSPSLLPPPFSSNSPQHSWSPLFANSPLPAQHQPQLFYPSETPTSSDSSPESPHLRILSSSPLSPAHSQPPSPIMLPARLAVTTEAFLATSSNLPVVLTASESKSSHIAEAYWAQLRHLYPSPSPPPSPDLDQTRLGPLETSEVPKNIAGPRTVSPSSGLETAPEPSVEHSGPKLSSKMASMSTRKKKRRTPRLGMPPRRRRSRSRPMLPDNEPKAAPEAVGVKSPELRAPTTPPSPSGSTGSKPLQHRRSSRVASRNDARHSPDLSGIDAEDRPRVRALLVRARAFDWSTPKASIQSFCRTFENGAGVEYLLRNKYRSVMKSEPQLRDRL